MRLIEIKSLDNGAHRNQTVDIDYIPEGWAKIPDKMETPNFPFGEIEVEEIEGIPTVTKWTPGTMPEPEPIVTEPTATELLNIILGVNE